MEALKKRRGIMKTCLTKMKNYANNITDQTEYFDIKIRLEKAVATWHDLELIEQEMFAINPDIESDQLLLEDDYFYIIAKFNDAIRKRDTLTPVQNRNIDDRNVIVENNPKSFIRLPRLELPIFSSGNREYLTFINLFNASVHSNNHLTPAEKLNYLKPLLKGEAELLVRNLTITDENYQIALNKLKTRFDKPRAIITAHLKLFCDQPSINSRSSTNLRRIADTADEAIKGLSAMGAEAEKRDPVLIHILLNKFDDVTKQKWAEESHDNNFPTFEEFLAFINKQADIIEGVKTQPSQNRKPATPHNQSQKHTTHTQAFSSVTNYSCSLCEYENHPLIECAKFKAMNLTDRKSFLSKEKRCYNCLSNNHSVKTCWSKQSCMKCKKRHHTMLHEFDHQKHSRPEPTQKCDNGTIENQTNTQPCNDSNINAIQSNLVECLSVSQSLHSTNSEITILPTAMAFVKDSRGNLIRCRILLDSGSMASFVSQSCSQLLNLPRVTTNTNITGIGSTDAGVSKGMIKLEITSIYDSSVIINTPALIMAKLTNKLPSVQINHETLEYLRTLKLADESFDKSNRVDVIIGAAQFFKLLKPGHIELDHHNISVQETALGWIVAGEVQNQPSAINNLMTFHSIIDIDKNLQRFWEIEEVQAKCNLTRNEMLCEKHFVENYCRSAITGRYVVKLPFTQQPPNIGNSLTQAVTRFINLEKRLEKNDQLREEYIRFMSEYQSLGHMKEITPTEMNDEPCCYLPHHPVVKISSTTTKVRVVFDASSKTDSGHSLNENLHVGPTIQDTLWSILIRFRIHRYVISADIEKMYRQIEVAPKDSNYQRIVWRNQPSEPLKHFNLVTVTYGTSPAPFLAVRSLQQLATDERQNYPLASTVTLNDFYVDDLLTGCDTIDECIELQSQTQAMLRKGGFTLRKWTSNNVDILKCVDVKDREMSTVDLDKDMTVKILGLFWNPTEDCYSFKINLPTSSKMTKRSLLSEASRLYDPLGWLAPFTINVKIMFQKVWLESVSWDELLPPHIIKEWSTFRDSLPELQNIKIPRWINTSQASKMQLHGFSDASEQAYSAVIYCRTEDCDGVVNVKLVTSKTKVAPLKKQSIPRLELCGAQLLAELLQATKVAMNIDEVDVFAWTDATIVLCWLNSPNKWKTYVSNRIANIDSKFPRRFWNHVPTSSNPADCASRGIDATHLISHQLWWNGPPWLHTYRENWPEQPSSIGHADVEANLELKKIPVSINVAVEESSSVIDDLFKKHSSISHIERIIAYCFKFYSFFRAKRSIKSIIKSTTKQSAYLTADELNNAHYVLVRWSQHASFSREIQELQKNKSIKQKSSLDSYTPFLDNDNTLRTGGRLENADIKYTIKHPAILSNHHVFTERIVHQAHLKHLHAGPNLLLSILRQTYMILRAKNLVRKVISSCVVCTRHKKKTVEHLMGDLPISRVKFDRAFLRSGVDYAGPITLKQHKGRGAKTYKGYLSIFVCMTTKAAHIEVVTDATAEGFLAAYRRFVSRRGKCTDLYSDNGKNFVGAKNEMKELRNMLKGRAENNDLIARTLLEDGTNWHMIPPAAPHMGGLWEALVKSTKFHIRRVIGNTILTYEEMCTLTHQIEAILNSRPLCPLSSESFDPLTPAHFITGHSLVLLPDHNLQESKTNTLSRWQLMQQMVQHFWSRWNNEYLTTLNQRTKWKSNKANLKINDIVLIQGENLPPSKWLMGKIVKCYPGKDNISRVFDVKTQHGILQRPAVKLCILPVIESEASTGRDVQDSTSAN